MPPLLGRDGGTSLAQLGSLLLTVEALTRRNDNEVGLNEGLPQLVHIPLGGGHIPLGSGGHRHHLLDLAHQELDLFVEVDVLTSNVSETIRQVGVGLVQPNIDVRLASGKTAASALSLHQLVRKLLICKDRYRGVASVILSGGVAINKRLRRMVQEQVGLPVFYPDPKYCGDNAAMIASFGAYKLQQDPELGSRETTWDAYSRYAFEDFQ